jgi:CBS domain containing-hemolysin-like protein
VAPSSELALTAAATCGLLRALISAGAVAVEKLPLPRARALAAERPAGRRVLSLKLDREGLGRLRPLIAALLCASVLSISILPTLESGTVLEAALAALGAALALGAFELVLRSLALGTPEPWALALSRLVTWSVRVCRPLEAVEGLTEGLLRPLSGARPTLASPLPSLEELEIHLSTEARDGRLGRTDPELLHSVIGFSEKTAREVMVPRTQIVGVELQTPPEELVRLISEEGHSRLPVYRESIDDLVGVLHSRDLVPLLVNPQLIVIQDLLRPVMFVPWAKPIGTLLREMQHRRVHLAMVVDEYGGVMGLVTLEDILEALVGTIEDDYRQEEKEIEFLADGSATVLAQMKLADFAKAFGISLPSDEHETVGGWLNAQAGAIPEMGERFFAAGLQITVVDRNARMVHRVKVQRFKGKAAPQAGGGGRGVAIPTGSQPGVPGRPAAPAPRTRG